MAVLAVLALVGGIVIFVGLAALSDSAYALVAAALAGRARGSARVQRLKRYVTGGIFVALGATAAAAKRAAVRSGCNQRSAINPQRRKIASTTSCAMAKGASVCVGARAWKKAIFWNA